MALSKSEIKKLTTLHTKRGRMREKLFMAEGVRLLEEALTADYLPITVLYAPSETGQRGQELIKAMTARKIETMAISARELHRLSDTKSSQGIIAVFGCREHDPAKQDWKRFRRILVCDRIGDPGNLGTLIRSAVAFGFDLVVTTRDSAEIFNPKAIRASMGGFFKIPIVGGVEDLYLADRLSRAGTIVYNADIYGDDIGRAAAVSGRAALVLGSEASGSGRVLAKRANYRLRIPMSEKVESLNAAVAGALLMFWMQFGERIKA